MERFVRDSSKDANGFKKNLFDLYSVYEQYKMLFNFYQDHKNINFVMIKDRVEYIKKHPKTNQKSELETLLWILGEIDE